MVVVVGVADWDAYRVALNGKTQLSCLGYSIVVGSHLSKCEFVLLRNTISLVGLYVTMH